MKMRLLTFGTLACGLLALVAFLACSPQSVTAQSGAPAVEAATSASPVRAGDFPLDSRPLDRSGAGGRVTSYADVLDKATAAVVSVYPSRYVRSNPMGRRQLTPEEFFRRFWGMPDESPDPMPSPRGGGGSDNQNRGELRPVGLGSGVIVSSDGYILTNNHVVSDDGRPVDEIRVRLNDGRELVAELKGADPRTDIAVLKVDAKDLPVLPMADSDNLRVGDIVFAVGNPLEVGLTVTKGIVSAMGRTGLGILGGEGYENFIQTDASINPGNSGGALVDAEGRLIGINTAIISRSGGNIGIGFAIPVNLARSILLSLLETGEVQRGFLGVNIRDLTQDLAEASGLPNARGALINNVQPGLPADKAGLRPGDIVTAINGRPIATSAELRLTIAQTLPGTTVKLTVFRGGQSREVEVTLGNLNDPTAPVTADATATPGGPGRLVEGVRVAPISAELRSQYRIPEEVKSGVVVTNVANDSPFAATLRAGVVILAINDVDVTDAASAAGAVRNGPNKLYIWENGAFGFIAIRVRP